MILLKLQRHELKAGAPQCLVLSPTLFVLHKNDMLQLGNINVNADDITAHGRYIFSHQEARPIVQSKRQELVRELDDTLTSVPTWGQVNLVEFNMGKIQVSVISKKNMNTSYVSFLGSRLPNEVGLDLLGVSFARPTLPQLH